MPALDSLPRKIGPYRVIEKIGEGGMGVVYLGTDSDKRRVAIKVLGSAVAGDPSARQRLAREVETMRRVRNRYVAEVIDADVDGPSPYIVTRYVPGRTLEDTVRQDGPLRGMALDSLAEGLAEALAAIHAAGVVHRDLKPGNVMLDRGQPVLIDFGIAHVQDATRLTKTGLVMGTPGLPRAGGHRRRLVKRRVGRALLGRHGGVRRHGPPAVRQRATTRRSSSA